MFAESFSSELEKLALSGRGKALLGAVGAGAAGLGLAAAFRPRDVTARGLMIASQPTDQGVRKVVTPLIGTQRRPLLFGRKEHRERVENPRGFTIGSIEHPLSLPVSASAMRRTMDRMGFQGVRLRSPKTVEEFYSVVPEKVVLKSRLLGNAGPARKIDDQLKKI